MNSRNNILRSFSLLILLALSACNSNKNTSTSQDNSYLIVGEGGGFAGTYEQYKINQDGLIEVYNFKEKNYSTLCKVKSKEVIGFFDTISSLNLGEVEMESPGNMSQYLEINYQNIHDHKLIWEKRKNSVNEELQALFDASFSFCRNQIVASD